MNFPDIDKAIELFTQLSVRRAVFVGGNSQKCLEGWLNGFDAGIGLFTSGNNFPLEAAAISRGWESNALSFYPYMKQRCLTEEEQCMETIAIYIEALKMLKASQESDS